MTLTDNEFDADATLEGARSWIECESPTYDGKSVDRMMAQAIRALAFMRSTSASTSRHWRSGRA